MAAAEPIVVCPLEFERRALHRAGLGDRCRLVCCGPGPQGVGRWASACDAGAAVILCGLAGSVSGAYHARSAYVIGAVLADDGRRLEPSFGGRPDPAPLIGSAERVLSTLRAKQEWAGRTGADLVDLESATFARIAVDRGWPWTIVRGVGDGPQTPLPACIDAWVDDRGRTRTAAAWRALARGRAGLRQLLRLRSDGLAALRTAAEIIRRMLDDLDGSSPRCP